MVGYLTIMNILLLYWHFLKTILTPTRENILSEERTIVNVNNSQIKIYITHKNKGLNIFLTPHHIYASKHFSSQIPLFFRSEWLDKG